MRDQAPQSMRQLDVRLRHHADGTPMADDQTYEWSGPATDEAHAVVLARAEAKADGWTPSGAIAYRVVENVDFLPVAHEWVEQVS